MANISQTLARLEKKQQELHSQPKENKVDVNVVTYLDKRNQSA